MELGGPQVWLSHLELHGVDEFPTFVTLVPSGLGVATEGTGALHKTIGQVTPTALAPELLQRVLQQEPPLQQPLENVLGDPGRVGEAPSAPGSSASGAHLAGRGSPGLLGRGGAAEVVEGDAEPGVDVGVEGVVAIAEHLGAQPLLQRPRLRGRAVLVRATHEQGVPAPQPAVPEHARHTWPGKTTPSRPQRGPPAASPGEGVGAEHAADDVAQVRDVVHVGKGAGDQHVPLTFHR